MTDTQKIFTRDQAKRRAKAIRAEHVARGEPLSHCAALELVAKEQGYASWNVMSARLSNMIDRKLAVGEHVSGMYLKQPFSGTVVSLQSVSNGGAYRLAIDLDEAIDVVEFDSFSNMRKRINGTIARNGLSYAKTSDGNPHLVISGS